MKLRLALGIVVTSCVAACTGGSTSPDGSGNSNSSSNSGSSSGTLVFRAAPLDESVIAQIIPLGNLNPPGHTFPTDHIYINNRRIGAPPVPAAAVYAPGDGKVQWIIRSGVEAKIGIVVGSSTYYLDHVQLDGSITEGTMLTAGQRIGQSGSLTYGIDLGVFSSLKKNFFINPARYPPESVNGDAPLKYFEEPLRSRLYALVYTASGDRDGRFDYDVSGYLAGNWFLEGLPVEQSGNFTAWPQHLAFVYDNYDPSSIRVSIGGTLGMVGAYAVQAGAPDPRTVSAATGKVAYQLTIGVPPGATPDPAKKGLLIVQMLDASRIRVEVFSGSQAADADFTSAARVYVR